MVRMVRVVRLFQKMKKLKYAATRLKQNVTQKRKRHADTATRLEDSSSISSSSLSHKYKLNLPPSNICIQCLRLWIALE